MADSERISDKEESDNKKNPRQSQDTQKNVEEFIPPHLMEPNWLEYEYCVAQDVIAEIECHIEPVHKKAKVKDIHQIRVCLRRWFSIWKVLKQDGWETPSFNKKIHKKLKRFYRTLGVIRDWDVNCKLARKLELPESVVESWKLTRRKERKKQLKSIKQFELRSVIKQLKRYLKSRFVKLRIDFIRYQGAREETVFSHFENFLSAIESRTRELSREFKVMEDIHQLRLSIKAWRYLLVEFYGVSNLSLVDCQGHLGQAVDYDRLRLVLESSPKAFTDFDTRRSIHIVVAKRNTLIKEIVDLKKSIPYGFRPIWISQENAN